MEYQTEQKKRLLSYLAAHADRVFTVQELAPALVACGVGESTVYRLVARLMKEGQLRRFAREEGRGYAYQYVGEGDCHTHLHLRCIGCDRVMHMDGATSAEIGRLLLNTTHFALDDERSMLYGRCEQCGRRPGEERR